MLQGSIVVSTLGKYRTLKNFDAEINNLMQDLVNCCVDYINGYFPKDVIEKAKLGPSNVLRLQRDLDIYYCYDLSKFKKLNRAAFNEAAEYFPTIRNIPLGAQNLPLFVDSSTIFSSGEDHDKFAAEFPEFIKMFKDKYSEMVLRAQKYSQKLKALSKVLSSKEATLTLIKENYPELYNLIKS